MNALASVGIANPPARSVGVERTGAGAAVLSSEARVLLATISDRAWRDADEWMNDVINDPLFDWDRFCWIAHRERASTIAWKRLGTLPPDSVPRTVRSALQALTFVGCGRMTLLEDRLAESIAALSAEGIPVTLLKGAALATTVYGSFAERPMVDVDLLIDRAHAPRAYARLMEMRWRPRLDGLRSEFYRDHHHLPPLDDVTGSAASLELHTGLFPPGHPFLFSEETFQAASRRIEMRGCITRAPDPTHQLLHLCVHFTWSHTLASGAWRMIRDIEMLTAAGIDWLAFTKLAVDARAASCCYWPLRLARHLAGTPVPVNALAALRPLSSDYLLDRLEAAFVLQLLTTENACPSVGFHRMLWELAIQTRRSGHGQSRPWRRTATLPTTTANTESVVRRINYHVRELRRWSDYLGAIFTASSRSAHPHSPT